MRQLSLWLVWGFQLALGVGLEDTLTLGSHNLPRVLSTDVARDAFDHPVSQNHTVLFFHEDSGEMYAGGTDFVLKIDMTDYHIIERIPLNATDRHQCREASCANVITVIEKSADGLLVCGTNGHTPQCWRLRSSTNQSHEIVERFEGLGISPITYAQDSVFLTVEGNMYAAAALDAHGDSMQFRAKLTSKTGRKTNMWMYERWVSEPTFVSASWVRRNDDADNEVIYIFFREKNADPSPEAEPWISRVARICKLDEGGSKRLFQNIWTSFLKARLVCGFPAEPLYFNRLQDIYVMQADDWHQTRVYALFTSSWNSTAVCVYSIAAIEDVFEKSTFKGYNNEVPQPRPGKCVVNSRGLPLATINVLRSHSEMSDWVHPLRHDAPFYVSNNNYTKISVDRVEASDGQVHNVLLLATESGKIHKVLEVGSEPFIISETRLQSQSNMQSMKLDSRQKKLVVGFSEKITVVDLRSCSEYNKSCEDCVLARDPYCAWTENGCSPTVPGSVQSIGVRDIGVCSTSGTDIRDMNRTRRDAGSPSTAVDSVHSVSVGVPFYLSCPIHSYHAVYTWEHRGRSSPCLQMRSVCLHLIPAVAQENYGSYMCVSKEENYTKVVKRYHLTRPILEDRKERGKAPRSDASVVGQHVSWLTLGLSAVALTNTMNR